MSTPMRDNEGADEFSIAGGRIRAGFRGLTDDPLAGGPIEIEFFVENLTKTTLQLAVGGDRSRQRPGQVSFHATFDGEAIGDPLANTPELGGPLGVVEVTIDRSWRQPLVLNQFLALESIRDRLNEGESGRLKLLCQRPLTAGETAADALTGKEWPELSVELSIEIRRDDSALGKVIDTLYRGVATGSPGDREHPLELLLSLRSVAQEHLAKLTESEETAVAERARRALAG